MSRDRVRGPRLVNWGPFEPVAKRETPFHTYDGGKGIGVLTKDIQTVLEEAYGEYTAYVDELDDPDGRWDQWESTTVEPSNANGVLNFGGFTADARQFEAYGIKMEHFLGKGAFSAVFAASDMDEGNRLAVKFSFFRPDWVEEIASTIYAGEWGCGPYVFDIVPFVYRAHFYGNEPSKLRKGIALVTQRLDATYAQLEFEDRLTAAIDASVFGMITMYLLNSRVPVHGDVSKSNIMLGFRNDNAGAYFIDWSDAPPIEGVAESHGDGIIQGKIFGLVRNHVDVAGLGVFLAERYGQYLDSEMRSRLRTDWDDATRAAVAKLPPYVPTKFDLFLH